MVFEHVKYGEKGMSDYTIKQHYVSKYILKRFINQHNKIDAILLQENELRRVYTNIRDICLERDFYEDIDHDGQYIERNRTENKFASMENEIARHVDSFIELVYVDNNEKQFADMISSGQWESNSVWLMFHLTLVMVRSPMLKEIVFGNDDMPREMLQIFYKELVWGKEEAQRLAENTFQGEPLSVISEIIHTGELEGGSINILMNHLVNDYYIEIYKVPEQKKYYLTDNPVIVKEITGVDYFLPLTPDIALVVKRIPSDTYMIQPLSVITEHMVDCVNQYLIQNSDKVIIVQDMTYGDFTFIEKVRKKIPISDEIQ